MHSLAIMQKEYLEEKEQFEIIDLHKIKFDPVMHLNELYTAGGKKMASQVKKFQKQIAATDKLIFIYPVWWYAAPAMMKGFFDKTLTPGFAFKYEGGGLPTKLLKGKKAAVFFTTGGPKFVYRFIQDPGAKTVKSTLSFCGIASKNFHFGSARRVNDEARAKMKKLVEKGINYLL